MAKSLNDLTLSQRRTSDELRRLVGELRRRTEVSPPIRVDRSTGYSDTLTLARTALLAIRQTQREPGAAQERQASEATTSALREVAAGLAQNTSALQNSVSAARRGLSGIVGELLGEKSGGAGISGLLLGGLGLAPLGSSILNLFRRERSGPEHVQVYAAPSPVNLSLANGEGPAVALPQAVPGERGTIRAIAPSQAPATSVVVNVSAMDARSFMDRSGEIASAVRDAMLHMHPLNDVIEEL